MQKRFIAERTTVSSVLSLLSLSHHCRQHEHSKIHKLLPFQNHELHLKKKKSYCRKNISVFDSISPLPLSYHCRQQGHNQPHKLLPSQNRELQVETPASAGSFYDPLQRSRNRPTNSVSAPYENRVPTAWHWVYYSKSVFSA